MVFDPTASGKFFSVAMSVLGRKKKKSQKARIGDFDWLVVVCHKMYSLFGFNANFEAN